MRPTNYFVLLLISFLFLRPGFAQSQSSLGVSGGLNISKTSFDQFENNNEAYLGYYGGLRAHIPIKGNFALVSNLIYSRKGWDFDPFQPTGDPGGTMNMDYLDLQLSCQYAIIPSLAVDAGVEVGRLLKTRRDPHIEFFDDFYEKGDFSLLMGISYKIWKSIRVEARYLHGLSHLATGYATDGNGYPLNVKVKQGNFRVFQIGMSADIVKLKSGEKEKV
jgi:hypothetical protein